MPALTNPKHERFAQELASGKPYHQAYVQAGYKPNPSNACNLQKTNRIAQRLTELLEERERIQGQVTADAIKAAGLTKAWIIERLIQNAGRAMQAEAVLDRKGIPTGEYVYQGSVANRAFELLGKELGMFIDRKEVGRPGEFESMNADQLREYIGRETAKLGARSTQVALTNGSGKPH